MDASGNPRGIAFQLSLFAVALDAFDRERRSNRARVMIIAAILAVLVLTVWVA